MAKTTTTDTTVATISIDDLIKGATKSNFSKDEIMEALSRVAKGGRPDRDSQNAQTLRKWFAESGLKRNEAAHYVDTQAKAEKKAAKAAAKAAPVAPAAPAAVAVTAPPPKAAAAAPAAVAVTPPPPKAAAAAVAPVAPVVEPPTGQEIDTRGRKAEVSPAVLQQLKAAGFALQGEKDGYGLILMDKFAVAHAPILINHHNFDPRQRGLKVAYVVVGGYVSKDGALHLNYTAIIGGTFAKKDETQGYYNWKNHVVDTTFDDFQKAHAFLNDMIPVLAKHNKW